MNIKLNYGKLGEYMSFKFEVTHTCSQSGARVGKLTTKHGVIETPVFMPVGTLGTVKTLTPSEIEEVSEGLILGNTYHLWQQPGLDVINKHEGLHNMMRWKNSLLTDSGGFQVFSLAKPKDVTEDGVYFNHHKSGKRLFLSPKKSIEIQMAIGADIIMSFDHLPAAGVSKQYLRDAIDRTIRWAKIGKETLTTDQALFGIVQGGIDLELRTEVARRMMEIDFPGFSIGGLSVGESKKDMYTVTRHLNDILPKDKPRYLMGVGAPEDLLENVINGVDMFDCVMPTRNARHGSAFTSYGKVNIRNKKYELDLDPIDPTIKSIANDYSKSYIRHLFKANEILGMKLLTYQNLAYLKHLMAEIRQAIKENRLLDYQKEFYEKTTYLQVKY